LLARAKLSVLLADRHAFPRDKACGDALLPDAMAALERLGVLERVLEGGLALDVLRVHSPGGHHADIRGRFAALPRRALDDLLREEAVRAGARFVPRAEAEGPITAGNAVGGARLRGPGGEAWDVKASATILATGASPGPLRAFGASAREEPDAFAIRAYLPAPPALAEEHRRLAIVYERSICPAYGWVFALPDGRFNIGAGWIGRGPGTREKPPHLRRLLRAFIEAFPPARDIVRASGSEPEVRGAPIRTSFGRDGAGRRGLLVAGEAAGLTYPFTGEGIGKAIESGMLAAEALLRRFAAPAGDPPGAHADYGRAARAAFGARFATYRRAQAWVASPWLCDLLCRRAAREGWVRRQIEGMIAETANPRSLFSPWGLARVLVG
jgi:flavin-dependent dehydrogenase